MTPRDDATLNPYQAPAATVVDADEAGAGEPMFFAVGLFKLAVMSVCTLGLYKIYWFYLNWKAARRLDGDRPLPLVRAIFYPIMSYALFRRVDNHALRLALPGRISSLGLGLALFILDAAYRLPDPWWLVAFASFVPLLPVQAAVNAMNERVAPNADRNRRFTAWNILGVVLGVAFIGLILIGLFVAPPPPAPNV